jgi:hypothetical protein
MLKAVAEKLGAWKAETAMRGLTTLTPRRSVWQYGSSLPAIGLFVLAVTGMLTSQ